LKDILPDDIASIFNVCLGVGSGSNNDAGVGVIACARDTVSIYRPANHEVENVASDEPDGYKDAKGNVAGSCEAEVFKRFGGLEWNVSLFPQIPQLSRYLVFTTDLWGRLTGRMISTTSIMHKITLPTLIW
jgi:hypothetical protein